MNAVTLTSNATTPTNDTLTTAPTTPGRSTNFAFATGDADPLSHADFWGRIAIVPAPAAMHMHHLARLSTTTIADLIAACRAADLDIERLGALSGATIDLVRAALAEADAMNDPTAGVPAPILSIGAPLAGGFHAGQINVDGVAYVLIMSPAAGALKGAWHGSRTNVPGAEHFADGLANTQAMAAAGSALAASALALDINGFTDWYLPSRDELELLYRHFKPTGYENYADGIDGVNEHSVPQGGAYSEAVPGLTAIAGFENGGTEALDNAWHWSSTQYAPDPYYAWYQNFGNGLQDGYVKSATGRARAVRRLKI